MRMKQMMMLIVLAASFLEAQDFDSLTRQYETLCTQEAVPALMAGVIHKGSLLWQFSHGSVDMDMEKEPDMHTPFRIASISKPISAVLILQLVEAGRLDLEQPLSELVNSVPAGVSPGARLEHLLSHTSHSEGADYAYSGRRFDLLTAVLEQELSMPFNKILEQQLFSPLALKDASAGQFLDEYNSVNHRLAAPLQLNRCGEPVPGRYPPCNASAAAGLILSLADLAAIDTALGEGTLVSRQSLELMWQPFELARGRNSIYGMGWFVQVYRGEKLVWHYGYWDCVSALWLKIPDRDLTLVLLSNSDRLARDVPLYNGDVSVSPFAELFLNLALNTKTGAEISPRP
jgi:CubicO group peptidase (beta-lactamase class C family)